MESNDSPRMLSIFRRNIYNYLFESLYLHNIVKYYICKIKMTRKMDEIIHLCEVLSNKHRLRIIAALSEKRKYTYELVKELEISRPLLYLHLRNLEEVGILKGKTELGKGNRAMRYYELCDFELCLNGRKIKEMAENEEKKR